MSAADITAHWSLLRSRGVDLGVALAPVQDAGFGGLVRQYTRGNIYWHASTGAHEVHGGILSRYIGAGAQGPNLATGERELGFPLTDEISSDDGLYPYSFFEWGTIAWARDTGGVRLFGELFKAWRASGGVLGKLGHPIADVGRVGGGRAAYFQRGVLWHAENSTAMLMGELITPLLGCPQLIDPVHPPAFPWVRFTGAVTALDRVPGLATELWRDRLVLVPVKGGSNSIQVHLTPAATATGSGLERALSFAIVSDGSVGGGASSGGVVGRPVNRAFGNGDNRAVDDAVNLTVGDAVNRTLGAGVVAPDNSLPTLTELNGSLVRRTLYSVAFRVPGRTPTVIAPHSVYARSDWASFNIAHITDLHISRRLEKYRSQMRKTGVPAEDIALYNNWNDAFRDFIRYANHLHSVGLLDAIMATGDLVDYVHEAGDNRRGPGNFGLFENLIRGNAPSPDSESPPSEPLRVPIFTSLGNHDYRANPYALGFKLKVTGGGILNDIVSGITGGLLDGLTDAVGSALDAVPGLGLIGSLDPIAALSLKYIDALYAYSGLNLTRNEALKVLGLKRPDRDEWYVPVLSPEVAARQALIDPAMRDGTQWYFNHINRNRSYFVQMGINRLVMLDTRHDRDITDTVSETLITKLGFGSESSENFLAVSPDSVGINNDELGLVRAAIDSAGANGIVLVGMHAPPINPSGNMMLAHFRETMHPAAAPEFVTAFLLARDTSSVMRVQNNTLVPRSDALTTKSSWPRNGTPHFHAGTVEDLMDYGIAVGLQEELMKLFSGADGRRPATLVVCGHGHYRFDYRSKWNARLRQLEIFTDHYLENPTSYYPVKLFDKWYDPTGYRRRLVTVKAGTPVAGTEQNIHDHQSGATWSDLSVFNTPPYAEPLATSKDAAAWWRSHEPIIVQTAALGPASNTRRDIDTNGSAPGPNFQGFRIIQITNNVIQRVRYITIPELRAAHLNLPWEHTRLDTVDVSGALDSNLIFASIVDETPTPELPKTDKPQPVLREHR
ncbi:MAG: metallophosphoesterase [Gemmatimonas sp.]